MAKKLRVGDTVHGYRVTKIFGPGMMAISYGAESPSREKIFLKQYKSPSPAVVWYRAFVDYQHELSSRIGKGKAAHYAVRLIDTFEERWGGPTYFAAYEFVENGRDLEQMLEEEREIHRRTKVAPTRDPAVWARHVTWAKVLMAGIAALHESKIVHADLKPANAYLIKDPSIASGYQLKLIDTDFSVLTDRRAPWHGHQGYVGTDNYRSPEHMTRGAVPVLVRPPAANHSDSPTKATPAAGSTLKSDRIQLVAPNGESLRIGVRTEIGKAVLRRFGPEAEFWDTKQCTVERRSDGHWVVTPASETVNETLINGAPLTTARALSDGDVIAAGRSAKGIIKLPLTAHGA